MPMQNLQCPFCPKTSSHGAGLASHIRGTHPKKYRGWARSRHSPQSASAPGLSGIIASLEEQKSAIERALSALDDLGVPAVASAVEGSLQPTKGTRSKRRDNITPEGRKRLAEAMRRRWAVKRVGAGEGTRRAEKSRITASGHGIKDRLAQNRPGCVGSFWRPERSEHQIVDRPMRSALVRYYVDNWVHGQN